MAYCRFGDLNGYSNLYCYYDCYDRYVCHVASKRLPPGCPKVDLDIVFNKYVLKNPVWDRFRVQMYLRAMRVRHEWIKSIEYIPIDHPLAGASHSFDDIRDAIDFIQKLIDEGFNIPKWVIPSLEEEMEELNSQGVLL